jgi:Xaa-Pro aminopeptidase
VSDLEIGKLDQTQAILEEFDLHTWMLFVRESSLGGDPALPLIYDGSLTWQSAMIVTRAGDRIAIVGKLDDAAVRASGAFTQVIRYVQGIREPLREVIARLDPPSLALDFSVDDYSADGLSHGMYLLLADYLAGTPYVDRLVSAEGFLGALRGRKTAEEIKRIRAAIETAQNIFRQVEAFAAVGKTERQIARFMLAAADRCGVQPAWGSACPIVNTGPDSMVGHGAVTDLPIEPGHVLHIDFGVRQDGYCSDLQRCWYVPKPGESSPPAEVLRAFHTVADSVRAAADALRPGVAGWEVDAAGRRVVVEAGYPEYPHALGHHVGRSAHDGAGILGPRWERYGRSPLSRIEAGNVLTLEPSIEDVAGRGCLGLEEMVSVTETGCQWLSDRQLALSILKASPSP